MKLYIAEKPAVAKAIATALESKGQSFKKVGLFYAANNGDKIAYCRGHLLSLLDPHEHDEKLKKWAMADLPFFFDTPKKKPVEFSKEIFKGLKEEIKALKAADTLIHAGDPDDEGQLIVDEVLDHLNYKHDNVMRVFINDNTPEAVLKALDAAKSNNTFKPLGLSALARSIADAYYGFNLTRAYTLKAQESGFDGVLSVGRVQTPMLGLIVRRDRENADHKKQFYFTLAADFVFNETVIRANYQNNDATLTKDDDGRLTDETQVKNLAAKLLNKDAIITQAETKTKRESSPLPFNLNELYAAAYKAFDLNPDEVLKITQALRDNHDAITYNRSDCSYLMDEQHALAPNIIEQVGRNDPSFDALIKHPIFNLTIKHKAFNSSKTGAHHGIIPTTAKVDMAKLTKNEQAIYGLIVKRYIGLFLPDLIAEESSIIIDCDTHLFKANSKTITDNGWKAVMTEAVKDDDKDDQEAESNAKNEGLARLVPNFNKQQGKHKESFVQAKETKPQPLYTMASFILDLPRAAKYIKDANTRQVLLDRDKDKAGEAGGIGTSATRDSMIKTLLDRGFITINNKKKLVSTGLGQKLYDALPDIAKYPDLTAIWQEGMNAIAHNQKSVSSFLDQVNTDIQKEVLRVKGQTAAMVEIKYPCPKCQKALRRIKTVKGFFWGCSGFKEGCKTSFNDDKGKPVMTN
jgi:DNA topoisomerase-3